MSSNFFSLSLFWIFLLAGQNASAIQDPIYAPQDLAVPVFDKTGFIIDPDNRIIEEWKGEMIGSRETYFFSRYIEPVCVRVDHIRNPSDVEKYADKLVELWDLEKKTNGRFVFQLACASEKEIVYRFGSRIEEFYEPDFLDGLASDIEADHFAGAASGTGDFVSLQRLGDHIYEKIAFDAAIASYDGNNGMHTFYPDKVSRSPRGLTTMKESVYQGATNLPDEDIEERISAYEEKNYFEALSSSEANENFDAIITTSTYTNQSTVPNEREITGGHVTNPDKILNAFAVDTINALLDQLESSKGYQVAVVCLNSIGENDPHSWGTDLFNLWGIGQKETDNGLLMLLVHDQHAIEFITGRGTEGILTDVDCYNIQQEEMVPHFKNNDYVTGMIRGTQAVCDFFYGSPPIYSPGNIDETDYGASNYDEAYDTEEEMTVFQSGFFSVYMIIAAVMTAAWILMLILAFAQRNLYKRYFMMKFFSLTIWIFVFPIPFLLLYFVTKRLMDGWRNTERFSEKTGEVMHKLGDHEEDKHLQKGQISEEKVKSVDYDVWITIGATDVLILSYAKWFTKFNKCISCKFKTYFKVHDRTISAATYTSSGTGERYYRCENCGHHKTERYTIPRKTRSSSSSSSGGGWSSGGGGGGGSSYGGGSSRGGGAGSRW